MIRKLTVAVLLFTAAAFASDTLVVGTAGVQVSSPFNVKADLLGAASLQLYVDGKQITSSKTALNQSVTAADGSHLVAVRYLTSTGTIIATTSIYVTVATAVTPPPPPPTLHTVSLSWTASTSSGVAGYQLFRSSTAGGPYTPIATVPATTLAYDDAEPTGTCFYVATAVDGSGVSSANSNEVQAVIP